MIEANYEGKTFTSKDVLSAMDKFDREIRDGYTKWRIYAIRHNEKDYPPKEILRIIVGDIPIPSGGEPTNKYFKQLGYQIVRLDDDNDLSGLSEEDSEEFQFSFEKDLENTLSMNLEQIEPGLTLYKRDGLTGRQVDAGKIGRLDILAEAKDGALVVIELKAGEAGDRACGQILKYMGWVKEILGKKRDVKGIIIARDFTEQLRYASKPVPGLKLKRYQVKFFFEDV